MDSKSQPELLPPSTQIVPAKKTGRPKGSFTYTQEIGDAICALVAQGDSRRKAAEQVGVPVSTIHEWETNIQSFSDQYAYATGQRAEHYFEWIIKRSNTIKDKDDAFVARVQIDAIKWACSKLLPRKYADKIDVNVEVTAKRVVTDL